MRKKKKKKRGHFSWEREHWHPLPAISKLDDIFFTKFIVSLGLNSLILRPKSMWVFNFFDKKGIKTAQEAAENKEGLTPHVEKSSVCAAKIHYIWPNGTRNKAKN